MEIFIVSYLLKPAERRKALVIKAEGIEEAKTLFQAFLQENFGSSYCHSVRITEVNDYLGEEKMASIIHL